MKLTSHKICMVGQSGVKVNPFNHTNKRLRFKTTWLSPFLISIIILFIVANKDKNWRDHVKNQYNVDNGGKLLAFLKISPNTAPKAKIPCINGGYETVETTHSPPKWMNPGWNGWTQNMFSISSEMSEPGVDLSFVPKWVWTSLFAF